MTCPDNSKSLSVRRPPASPNCHLRLFKIVSLTRPRFGTLGPLPQRPEVLLRENDLSFTGKQNASRSELFDCLLDLSTYVLTLIRLLVLWSNIKRFSFLFFHLLDDTNLCKTALISTVPVPGPPALGPALLCDPEGRSPVSPPHLLLPITAHKTG